MNIPAELKYTADHEWVKIQGDTVLVGITDFAQSQLGDIVFVDINTQGETVAQGEVFGAIEAVKTVADALMPLTGEVLEVNEALADAPELVNTDPYNQGWMIKATIADPSQIEGLLDAAAYAELVK